MNKKKKNSKISLFLVILAFIFVIGYFTIWLLIPGMPLGRNGQFNDIFFHLSQIQGIANGLRLGKFPVEIYPGYFGGYGYANGIFYPDLFLYIPAFFTLLGLKLMVAYKIFLLLCTVFTALFMFICVKSITKSRYAGVIAMIIYTLASYRCMDIYTISDLGETLAFVFFPLVILGLYKVIYENYKQWYILTLGITAVFLSHEINAIFVTGFSILMLIAGIFRLKKEKKRILYFLLACGVAILLTSYHNFPLVQQILSQKFVLTTKTLTEFSLPASTMSFSHAILSFSKIKDFLLPEIPGIGIVVVLLPLIRLINIRRKRNLQLAYSDACMIMGFIALIAVMGFFPWATLVSLVKQVGAIQFSWRLLLPATAFLSVSSGIIAFTLFKTKKSRIIVLIIILILSVFAATVNIYADYSHSYMEGKKISQDYSIKFYAVGGGEYLPYGTNLSDLYHRGDVVTSNNLDVNTSFTQIGTSINLEFYDNANNNTYLELPLLYYLGYKATLTSDGKTINLPVEKGTNNIVKVPLDGYNSGVIKIYYAGTSLQHITFIISLITFILLILFIIVYGCKKRSH